MPGPFDLLADKAGDRASAQIVELMRTLYRARPFTKAVPFNQTLNDDLGVALWSPKNAHFEVGKILIRADTAGLDVAFCDSTIAQPFAFAMAPTAIYQEIDFEPGYRSLLYNNANLILVDPAATGATFKGVILGWEVTQDGYYR